MPCGDGQGWPYDELQRSGKVKPLAVRLDETPEERRARYAAQREYRRKGAEIEARALRREAEDDGR